MGPRPRWLYVITAPRNDVPDARARWEALLIVGAFRDLEVVNGLAPVAGYTLATLYGGRHDDRRPAVLPRPHEVVQAGASPGAMSRQLMRDARATRLQLRSLAFIRPLEPAVLVQAELARPDRYLEVLSQLVEAESQARGDGFFLEIHDSAGRVIMRYGFARRAARTVAWVDPELLRRS